MNDVSGIYVYLTVHVLCYSVCLLKSGQIIGTGTVN